MKINWLNFIIYFAVLFLVMFLSTKAYAMEYEYIMVHHTDTPKLTKSGKLWPDFDKTVCDRLAKKRGWTECGYNYMISRDGIVFKGRDLGKKGAHCPNNGMNRRAVGVAFVLRGTEESVTPEAKQAFFALKNSLEQVLGTNLDIAYHGDHKATLCPTNAVREAIKQ